MTQNRIGKILSNFHHVGVLVNNMDEAIDHYQSLGFGPFEPMGFDGKPSTPIDRTVYGEPACGIENIAMKAPLGPALIELVQPVSGKSVQMEWLLNKGEGINHICFMVDNIEEASDAMAEAGFKIITTCKFIGGGGMAYFDTDKVGGVQLELLEAPPK